MTVTGATTFNNSLTVSGPMTVSGSTNLYQLSISGVAVINSASGNVTLGALAPLHINNTILGVNAGPAGGLTASGCVVIGYQAGTGLSAPSASNNIIIGPGAGTMTITGQYNTIIGWA